MHHLIGLRKELGPKVILICIISAVWFTGNMALEYFLPIYLDTIGETFFEIGLLLAIASVSGLLIDVPVGKLSDISDKRKLMAYGLLLSPLFAFVVLHFSNFWLLAVALFMWGICFQTWKIARDTYLAESSKPSHRAESFGAGEESLALGAVIGPIIGGTVLVMWGGTGVWAVYTIFCIAAALMVHKSVDGEGKPLIATIRGICKNHGFLREELRNFRSFGFEGMVLLYLAFLLMMLEYMMFVLIPLMYTIPGIELNIQTGGMVLAVFSLPVVLFSIPFGKLADIVGKRRILVVGILLKAAGFYFFAMANDFWMLMLFGFVSAVGFALALPALDGLIVDKTRHHNRGELIGLWGAFMDAGYITGPLFGGMLADLFGIRVTFQIAAFLLGVSVVFVVWLEERKIAGPKSKSLHRYRRKRYPISL